MPPRNVPNLSPSRFGTLGATQVDSNLGEVVIDDANLLITSSCYMFDEATVAQIGDSTDKAVQALNKMLG